MPNILNHVNILGESIQDILNSHSHFGTILVYVCERDCMNESQGLKQEFLVIQKE